MHDKSMCNYKRGIRREIVQAREEDDHMNDEGNTSTMIASTRK